MKRQGFVQDSLPEDVALKIVSCLEVTDVCSLGCCSKYWREICESDYLWKSLCEERWPGVVLEEEEAETNDDYDQENASNLKGWRGLYVRKHNEMVGNAAFLKKGLSCQVIYGTDFLKAIQDMKSAHFGFNDVRILLLQPKIHVQLNLLGLYYSIKELGVQVGSVVEAISSCNIQDREVGIRWWKCGWLDPCVLYTRYIFLKDLTANKGKKILRVIEQAITRKSVQFRIFDAKQVEISAAKNEGGVII